MYPRNFGAACNVKFIMSGNDEESGGSHRPARLTREKRLMRRKMVYENSPIGPIRHISPMKNDTCGKAIGQPNYRCRCRSLC